MLGKCFCPSRMHVWILHTGRPSSSSCGTGYACCREKEEEERRKRREEKKAEKARRQGRAPVVMSE